MKICLDIGYGDGWMIGSGGGGLLILVSTNPEVVNCRRIKVDCKTPAKGGGNDSYIVKEGASLCIFMLTNPWSGSNLNKLIFSVL